MKKFFWGFIIIFFVSLILWAQEPTEDDAEEPAPIERVLPPLAPVKSPIPEPTVIQPEAPKEKPEDKIDKELPRLAPVDPPEQILEPQRAVQEFPGLAPVTPPEVILQPQRQIQQFPTLSPVSPPEQIREAQRQIQQFPALSPVSPPQDVVEPQRATQRFPALSPVTSPEPQLEPQRATQEFPALSPVTAPAFQDQVGSTLRRFQELSPVTAPASHHRQGGISDNPGNPGHLAYARQSFANLSQVGTPSSVYRTFRLSDFSGGLNKRDFPTEIADNEVTELVNFVWEGKKLRPRDGFTTYNATEFDVGKRIFGLYAYYKQNGDKVLLAGTNGYLAGDTIGTGPTFWVKTGLQENDKYYYFDTFKDKAIVAHEGDYPFWYDGDTTQNLGLILKEKALDRATHATAGCGSSPYTPRQGFTISKMANVKGDHFVGYTARWYCGTYGTLMSRFITGFRLGASEDTVYVPTYTACWIETSTVELLSHFSLGEIVDSGIVDTVHLENYTSPRCDAFLEVYDNDKSWTNHQYNSYVVQIAENQRFGGHARYIQATWATSLNLAYYNNLDSNIDKSPFWKGAKYYIRKLDFHIARLVKTYKNRIFLVAREQDPALKERIIFSKFNSLNDFPLDNYIPLNFKQGEYVTALATLYEDQLGYKDQSKDCLIIFTNNSIYKLILNSNFERERLGYSSIEDCYLVQVVEGIGCVAPQTVVNVEGKYLLFLHTTGVYAFDGRTVTPIYLNIQPLLADSINQNKIEMASAGYCDRHYYLSYPAGTSIENNKGIVFNVDLGVWGETDNFVGGIFAQQNAISDTVKLLFADSRAKSFIYQFGKVATDIGQPISLTLKSKAFNLGDLHKRKRFTYFDIDYYLDSDSVKTWFYTDFGDSLRYNIGISESGGNRHARIPLNADCLGRNFSFKLTSNKWFELGSVAFKFRQIGE